jgi:hypothetical protein
MGGRGPPATQPVPRRAPGMCSRSASANMTAAAVGTGACVAAELPAAKGI